MNAWFKPKLVLDQEQVIKQKAMEVIKFLNLTHLARELAGICQVARKSF